MKKITLTLTADQSAKFCDLCDHYGLAKTRTAQLLVYKNTPLRSFKAFKDTDIRGYKHLEYFKSAYGESDAQVLLKAMATDAHLTLWGIKALNPDHALTTIASAFGCPSSESAYKFLSAWAIGKKTPASRSTNVVHFGLTANAFDIAATLRNAIETEHKSLAL